MAPSSVRSQRRSNLSQRFLETWASLQVELQGCYSPQRLLQLQTYSAGLSSLRLVILCLLTPLPSLFLSLLGDVVPLPPMEAGAARNWFVFVRGWALTGFIGASVLVQIGQGVSQLRMTVRQVVLISSLAATIAIAAVALASSQTVFPLPFGTLFAGPPCVIVIGAGVIYVSRPRLQADPALWAELKRQLDVFHCMTSLTFIYPLYIYGYTSLTGMGQMAFALLSPVIQAIAKNLISRNLAGHDYMKPETIIFCAELFNALYCSSVLQGASSWKTTVLIMGTDIAQIGLIVFDMSKLLDEVNALMKRIPRDRPLANENFVQIAERLVNTEAQHGSPQLKPNDASGPASTRQTQLNSGDRSSDNSMIEANPSQKTSMLQLKNDPFAGRNGSLKWTMLHKVQVFPVHVSQFKYWSKPKLKATTSSELSLGHGEIFPPKERALFIRKTLQVLFVTEFVVLGEYLEVAMAIIFNLHQIVLFHMPNSAYYPALADLTSPQFYSVVYYRLLYAGLELFSLVMAVTVLKRILGFSPLSQLAFVLEKQAGTIQMKLVGSFVYIMQLSLKHVGSDFSFKFSWMQSTKNGS